MLMLEKLLYKPKQPVKCFTETIYTLKQLEVIKGSEIWAGLFTTQSLDFIDRYFIL